MDVYTVINGEPDLLARSKELAHRLVVLKRIRRRNVAKMQLLASPCHPVRLSHRTSSQRIAGWIFMKFDIDVFY
jgi:hypothetical protein